MASTRATRLKQIADQVQAQDDLCRMAARKSVDHAVQAGRLLKEAKDIVGHGGWLPWLKRACPFLSERTAQRYLSLAKLDPAKLADLKKPTLGHALAQIVRELKPDRPGVPMTVPTPGLHLVPSADDHRLDLPGDSAAWLTESLDRLEQAAAEITTPRALRRMTSEQRARARTMATAIINALDPATTRKLPIEAPARVAVGESARKPR